MYASHPFFGNGEFNASGVCTLETEGAESVTVLVLLDQLTQTTVVKAFCVVKRANHRFRQTMIGRSSLALWSFFVFCCAGKETLFLGVTGTILFAT